MLVRCPTVLQADVSLPLNVRSEIEVKRDVDLIATINVYPADQLVDNHLLRFKVGTVVQVSIGHSSVTITMNRYVHPSLELKRETMEQLADFISVK